MDASTIKKICIGLAVVIAVCLCMYMWRMHSSELRNNGAGASAAREQYKYIGQEQQKITAGIEQAKERATASEERLERSEQSAAAIADNIKSSGEAIENCKRIFREIRARGKIETP